MSTQQREHDSYQRGYYARPARKPGMLPGRTPVVARHLDEALQATTPQPSARILELGCGMGRFTALLAEAGHSVTAVDLSPDLLAVARAHCPADRVEFVCCEASEVERHVDGPFDVVLGFFFLHHLSVLEPTLEAAQRILRPEGRLAFVEPNGRNPLFYLQILLTPGMTFRGEPGIPRMRPRPLCRSFAAAGIAELHIARYGFFPPAIANHTLGQRLEAAVERLRPLEPFLPYQVIAGSRSG